MNLAASHLATHLKTNNALAECRFITMAQGFLIIPSKL